MAENYEVFDRIAERLRQRNQYRPADSYSTQMFTTGLAEICGKIREEAQELAAAGEQLPGNQEHVLHEAADLMFHMLMLLEARGASLGQVAETLVRREGISGLDEKRSRK